MSKAEKEEEMVKLSFSEVLSTLAKMVHSSSCDNLGGELVTWSDPLVSDDVSWDIMSLVILMTRNLC